MSRGGRDATVTVCIPVWNGEAFVEETLASVRAQTLDGIAVLVSVDKSDDRSLDICRAFAANDARFSVFAQPTRLGWIGNVNWLLRQAGTEFACVMPHDDVIAPVYLERLIAKLQSHPEAVLAYCDIATFGKWDGVLVGPEAKGDTFARIVDFLHKNIVAEAWRGVFRTQALNNECTLETVNGAAADQVWLLRLVVQGHLVRLPECLYRKRLHDESVVARSLNENDSHWADHCVSCQRIALAAGQWTDEQKHAIAVACLARALSRTPSTSMTCVMALAADYAQRLAGLKPPGSEPERPSEVPDRHRARMEHGLASTLSGPLSARRIVGGLWHVLARKAVATLMPNRRPGD
jgi:hypothetical protein